MFIISFSELIWCCPAAWICTPTKIFAQGQGRPRANCNVRRAGARSRWLALALEWIGIHFGAPHVWRRPQPSALHQPPTASSCCLIRSPSAAAGPSGVQQLQVQGVLSLCYSWPGRTVLNWHRPMTNKPPSFHSAKRNKRPGTRDGISRSPFFDCRRL